MSPAGDLPPAALAQGLPVPALGVAAVLAGIGATISGTLHATTNQRQVPAAVLARINSITMLRAFAAAFSAPVSGGALTAPPGGDSAPGFRHLPGGDVEAVEHVGGRDREDQGRERRRRSSTELPARWAPGGKPGVVFDFTISGGKIVAIDLLSDPELAGRLDVTILGQVPDGGA